MKHTCVYLILMFTAATSCTGSSPEDDGTALRLLTVTLPENTPETKAELTSIGEVNVYVTKADKSDYKTGASLLKFTNTSGSWSADKDLELTADAGTASIYGSYPVSSVVTNDKVMPKIAVQLLSADNFSGTSQTDYLYADQTVPVTASTDNRNINLKMLHALAKVSLCVSKASGVSEVMELTGVDIISRNSRILKGDGSMLLNSGILNALTETDSLHLTGSAILAPSQTTPNVNCLVAPMVAAESALSFSLHVKVGGVDRVFTTAPVTASVKWEKGSQYIYKIQINKMSGSLTDVSINKWQTDASPNTSIGI